MPFVALALLACSGDLEAPDASSGPREDGGFDAAVSDAGMVACTSDATCDDDRFCNGLERCAPNDPDADPRGCVDGRPPLCADGQRCNEGLRQCQTECDRASDAGGDGARALECGGDDCDDGDPRAYPGNAEICDDEGRDEDCDPQTFGARDRDGDGWLDALCCNVDREGTRTCGTDCDDAEPTVHPSEAESCDGLDNDCDAQVDEGQTESFARDADGDGFGARDGERIDACRPSTGYVRDATDCDDAEATIHPGATERCDGRDNNCDGALNAPGEDDDRDGFVSRACGGSDCADAFADSYPGAAELCDRRDNDCDGFAVGEDRDFDGFLAPDVACVGGPLGDAPRTDCDDGNAMRAPGRAEVCDGRDTDCDGAIDDGASASCTLPAATAACVAGACTVASCASGRLDCNRQSGDGCERSTTERTTCGSCDNSCSFRCLEGRACDDAVGIDTFGETTCIRTANGTLYCFGRQLGLPNGTFSVTPAAVPIPAAVVEVAIGPFTHACARDATGAVWCWGGDAEGQLGEGLFRDRAEPRRVPALPGPARHVWTQRNSSCALIGGDACCWGIGERPDGAGISSPIALCGPTRLVQAEGGDFAQCGVTHNGEVLCTGTAGSAIVAHRPSTGRYLRVSVGSQVACALREDRRAVCWGSNASRQLGVDPALTQAVVGPPNLRAIHAGGTQVCAETMAGDVECWGETYLGDGTQRTRYPTPTRVPLTSVRAFSAGRSQGNDTINCAIVDSGLRCWGWGQGWQQTLTPAAVVAP